MSLVIPAPRSIDRQYVVAQRTISIVFFGTPPFAVPTLRRLHAQGWPVSLVVTAPDKPTGRRMLLTPSPVKTAAEELGLPVRTPANLKDESFWQEFSELRPDLCVVVAYGKIIPKRYLDIPRLGFVNIHPSLLPAYRGPSPIQTAILDGCASTGVSIMQLDEDTDHGPVLAAEPWTIPSGFDYPMCEDELSRLGADLLARTLQGYEQGTVVPQPQNHDTATYTKKFTREDGRLDWTQDATRVRDRIRGLAANPGTWTIWDGKTLNIHHAHVLDGALPEKPPGSVFFHADQVAIRCGQGALALETVQLEGAKRMSAEDFARGRPTFVGSVLT
jgi:methionyl-tRNA formyltransferase